MSDIWSIIQRGKETLKQKEREEEDISNVDIIMLAGSLNDPQKSHGNSELLTSSEVDDLPDWLTKNDLYNIRKLKNESIWQLHEELFYLDHWLESKQLDKFMRETVYIETEKIIIDVFPEAAVYPFGSFLTDLSLPDSDLDLMVQCIKKKNYLNQLGRAITRSGIAKNVTLIRHTRVPLVKFRHIKTGIDVDISFNQDSSLLTSAYVIRQLDRYPYLRPMIRIVKYMLSQRGMNDTYTGGVGSFLATLLCLSNEQWCIRDGIDQDNLGNLGNHLIQFFYFFGVLFNYKKLTIRLQKDGGFLFKEDKDWDDPLNPSNLSVENPIDPSFDVGKASYQIKRFQAFCSYAFYILNYNLSQASSINSSSDGFLLRGLIRSAPRYPESITSSRFWSTWSQSTVDLPDAELQRQELIKRNSEAVKKCGEMELRNVYESDYKHIISPPPHHVIKNVSRILSLKRSTSVKLKVKRHHASNVCSYIPRLFYKSYIDDKEI